VLLIGASGQVGRELLHTLESVGQVACTHRGAAGGPPELELHLDRPETITRVFSRVRPDLVINAAGYTDVEGAERYPDLAMVINGYAPGILANEACRVGAALVHYSTDYVFDGSGAAPWKEHDRVGPLNAYGRSKLEAEEAIRKSGVSHLIVRTSWVYSPQGRNFVLTMLRLGRERQRIGVVNDHVGAPTSARTVAQITAQVLMQAGGKFATFLGRYGGLLHVCCQGEASWHGFAVEIFRQAKRLGESLTVQEVEPIASDEYPSRVRRPANSRLDCGRFRRHFGLVPPSWQAALQDCLEEMFAPQSVPTTQAIVDGQALAEAHP
jgi:dTDP-4-dehydrorhamnose reductase